MHVFTWKSGARREANAAPQVARLEDRHVPSGAGNLMHIHARLSIFIDGQPVTVPANIGVTPTVVQPIHTHDTTGTIHIESDEVRDFRLSEFFALWGEAPIREQLLNHPGSTGWKLTMTVNGAATDALGQHVLRDHDNIVLRLDRVAAPMGPLPVALQLARSAEHYQGLARDFYTEYLGRAADAAGLAYWSQQLQAGITVEAAEANFLATPEFMAAHGNGGRAWVDAVYEEVLHRHGDSGGLDYWEGLLRSGVSPVVVAHGIAASPERWGQRVEQFYTDYLGRSATTSERHAWVSLGLQGTRVEDLEARLLASSENYNHPQRGQNNPVAWVKQAYQKLLRRSAGDGEAHYWADQIG